jgi:hypothetical protein
LKKRNEEYKYAILFLVSPKEFQKFEDCALKYPNSVDEKCSQEWEGLNLWIFKFQNYFVHFNAKHLLD